MGVIHRVKDVELDRMLALKEMKLPADQHPPSSTRFLEEAQITAQLDHPGIVPIHEVGLDATGHLYFSPRCDVYSIGAMLYHLLTGETPHVSRGARRSQHTVLARVIEAPRFPCTTSLRTCRWSSLPSARRRWRAISIYAMRTRWPWPRTCAHTSSRGAAWTPVEKWLDDGWVTHAPVGTYAPNAFGLHEMTGNLWEWCRDGYGSYEHAVREGDGERLDTDLRTRIVRGSSFEEVAALARSSSRLHYSPDSRYYALGLRPARTLDENQ